MKNLILILCIVFVTFGCKKDKSVEKSRYAVWIIPDLISSSDAPIQIKYKISGTDIKTIDNLGPRESINYIDLPKGKSTTVTTAIYEGPQRYITVKIYKVNGDTISNQNLVFEQTAIGSISATFTVK